MNLLGCPDGYTAELRTRGGRRRVATLGQVTGVTWTRTLSETSWATVTVKPRGRGCSAALDGAIPWGHELALYRDRELVWCGPLMDEPDDGNTVTLSALDLSAWLGKRLVHDGYDTTGEPADLTTIAWGLLRDALSPDDPGVLQHVDARLTGVTAERWVDPETTMADADLAQLVALGLDWTMVGRRMVLFGRAESLGRIAHLYGRHFTGPLPSVRAGAGVVTRAVVQGGGVRGEAGGVHPVLGLLEDLVSSSTVESDEDAATLAAAHLYTPTVLLSGTELRLTARAPVSIHQLVPGVVAAVSGAGAACRVTGTAAQLTKVTVEWSPTGESVSPTFVEFADRTREVA